MANKTDALTLLYSMALDGLQLDGKRFYDELAHHGYIHVPWQTGLLST